MPLGIQSDNRELLERLHRSFPGPFGVADAADALELDRSRAQRLLAYLASRGWLSRVRRGLYTTVPLGASAPGDWRTDPWVVAAKTFAPCYVGGWSACEHWGLTEQVFRDVVVITAQPTRSAKSQVQGTTFLLKHRPESLHFGTRFVWRNRVRVAVSDPSRTLADILDSPELGGGIRHVADIISEYFSGEHAAGDELVTYMDKLGNRSAFKRLGYILEHIDTAPEYTALCRKRISKGLSSLDPAVAQPGRISKRWNLRVNVRLNTESTTR